MGWIVLIYSCLGWCCEVAFAALKTGKFVNRGFLNGPVCPIYGFGVLSVVLVLEPVKDNLLLLFFGSMVFTSLLEFIAGFAMERIFHDKWWDYSNNPFNIKGYICLEFSIIWGIACVLVVDVIHPIIMKLVNALPHMLSFWLMAALYVLLVTDAVLTLVELLKLPKRFKAMEEQMPWERIFTIPWSGDGSGPRPLTKSTRKLRKKVGNTWRICWKSAASSTRRPRNGRTPGKKPWPPGKRSWRQSLPGSRAGTLSTAVLPGPIRSCLRAKITAQTSAS